MTRGTRRSSPGASSTIYLLVSLSASYRLNRNTELFGRVENLLDSDYEEVLVYSTAPISAFGGVRMTFEADGPLEAAMK